MPFVAARDSRLRPTFLTKRPRLPIPALAGAVLALALWAGVASAQDSLATIQLLAPAPAPPTGVVANDVANDKGKALAVSWTASPDEKTNGVLVYRLLRADSADGPFTVIDSVAAG